MREDPQLRRRYASLKRELAAEYADDREAYTTAKGAFVRAALNSRRT